jgi:hypothetical protein
MPYKKITKKRRSSSLLPLLVQVYATEEDAFQRLLEGAVSINGEGAVTEEAARIIKERGIRR